MWVMAALVCVLCVRAQDTPVTSPTNSYYTPSQTYTPISTLPSGQSGTVIVMSGVGPSQTPDGYTWNYTAALSTLEPTVNPALSSSLAKSVDLRSTASNLEPDPKNLQTVGSGAVTIGIQWTLTALAAALTVAAVQL
ncbi:hypothetical protein GLX27_000834 [Malassezia furfur]|uniref:Uncharacterized protein n=1 Tax=Malassezia furfur TaxID=55194 RepID=A0ABY8EN05_MALFU|nr:hypothetical protein GLX27_000834 [Malassezia furfur]